MRTLCRRANKASYLDRTRERKSRYRKTIKNWLL